MAQQANNVFIGACLEFDGLIERLHFLRRSDFGVTGAERTWHDVGSVRRVNDLLTHVVRFIESVP